MMATTVVSTESQKASSYKYVKKRTAHLKIKCRIAKFEALMTSKPGGGGLLSEEVSSELVPGTVCWLRIYPNGCREQSKGNIRVFLHLTGPIGKKETQQATFHLYLVSGFDGKVNSIARDTNNFGEGDCSWGWDASHDEVKKALHADGSLTVAADIEFLPSDDNNSALQCDAEQHQWPTKFSELHGDQTFSDCSIEIGGVSIPAHKCILVAQSPIFRSMFSHQEADECKSGVIKVTDFTQPEPMRAVVRYCYLGFLDDSTMNGEGAVEMFKLADRYCIAGLKAHLEKHFADKSLNVENVVAMAVLADTYAALKLREACIKLIALERKTVFDCADWKEVMKARPELAAQLAVATCLKL